MLRALVLVSLSASLFSVGCSKDNGNKPPAVIAGADMADPLGTGGNGVPDMATASSGDMGPSLPDLAGLPAPDHDPMQHPPLPRMTNPATPGVNTISAPEVWTVVWTGDEATIGAQAQGFTSWMLASDYWKNGVKEYGVGAGTAKGVLKFGTPPPTTAMTKAQLEALIDNNVGKTTGWPAKSANLVISVVLNPVSSVNLGNNQLSCKAFDGFHAISPMQKVPYLLNAYCNNPTTMKPDWDNLTVTISHEAAEATTDYDLQHSHVIDPTSGLFPYLGGGEDGDMCISLNTTIKADATNTYMVQRLYSDAAAALNNVNPCIPDDTAPFFGAGLYGNDATNPSVINVTRDASGKGSATIKIEPFSYDPNFGAVAFYVAGSVFPAGITLTPDIAVRPDPNNAGGHLGSLAYGNPGSTTTVTVNVDATYVGLGQPVTFLIVARNVASTTRRNIWWGTLNVH